MARTKGSKNKKTEPIVLTTGQIREAIAQREAEIEELSELLKGKKTVVKELKRQLVEAEAAEAAAQAESEKEAVLAAFLASGKTAAEVIKMLKEEQQN